MKTRLFQLSTLLLLLSVICNLQPLHAQDAWRLTVNQPLQGDYYGITSANGQIGLVSSRSPLEVDKVVVGGLYDIYANARVDNFFPNINPLDIELRVNEERISRSQITNYTQSFDFQHAAIEGQYDWKNKVHVQYRIMALRQMPFGYMMDVTIQAQDNIALRVINQHRAPESLREVEPYFSTVNNKANPLLTTPYPHYTFMTTMAKSPTGRFDVGACTAFLFPDSEDGGTALPIIHRDDRGVGRHTQEFEQPMTKDQTLHFCLVGNIMGSNYVPDVRNEVERLTVYMFLEGYDRLMARHNRAWDELWQSDILVEGDAQAQQDIHSMLYHLYAFNRAGSGLSCSPMGLSGLGYNGHSFWDADTWMFPALAVLHPETAVEMLNRRYDLLDGAIKKAYMHGYRGAWFPWQTSYTGQEQVAPHNMYPSTECHITGDAAIACWQYYQLTQDKEWLLEKGWPILSLTADFWASRVDWTEDGYAHIINVIGADEWSCNQHGGKQIDDNAYTIGVARTNLDYAMRAAKVLGKKTNPAWAKTRNGLHYRYMDNGVIAVNATYHGEVTKQADVDLLAFPLHEVTDTALIRRDLEYYMTKVPDKRTPAMSKSIYATIYCRLGDYDKALYYFRDSYLPNLNPPFRVIAEFNGGTNPYFITGAGGTLQSLLFGFAGLDITDQGLQQVRQAKLPAGWKSLTVRRIGYPDIVIRSADHRLATYNVRYINRDPKKADKGDRSWTERREYVLRNVLENELDIVGMNEVTGNNRDSLTGKSQLQDLQDGLKDYTCIAYEREDKNYSYNCIFYRTNRYKCLNHYSFWLSETPDVASKGWGSRYYRRCIVALMQDIKTKQQFYFCCAHTDYEPLEVGEKQAELLGKKLAALSNARHLPLVLVGDLNYDRDDKPSIHAIYSRYFSDSSKGNKIPTYNQWKTLTDSTLKCLEIDYLYYLNMHPRYRKVVTEDYGRGVPPSDHFPVYVDFQL